MESKKEKFRRTLTDLADSGKYIPGIYNYCDRWCEKCTLSHRCLTYAHEQELKETCNNPNTNELDNDKFWEQIKLSFEVTLDLISEDAKRLGICLEELPVEEEPPHVESKAEELSLLYGHSMANWLEVNEDYMKVKSSCILTLTSDKKQSLRFADAVEIVKWYCFYISAKVHRSFFELNARQNAGDVSFDPLADNKGSAKVALIAVNRSLEALSLLYPQMKEQEDEILNFLALLSKIKIHLLATFPTAMDFKRPGFDD